MPPGLPLELMSRHQLQELAEYGTIVRHGSGSPCRHWLCLKKPIIRQGTVQTHTHYLFVGQHWCGTYPPVEPESTDAQRSERSQAADRPEYEGQPREGSSQRRCGYPSDRRSISGQEGERSGGRDRVGRNYRLQRFDACIVARLIGLRKEWHLPGRADQSKDGQQEQERERQCPQVMARRCGPPAGQPLKSQRKRQYDRRPDDEIDQARRFSRSEEIDHRPSRDARSMSARKRARSSGVGLVSSSSRSVATAPSTEPPKNVLTTCRIAERRARAMGTHGEYT